MQRQAALALALLALALAPAAAAVQLTVVVDSDCYRPGDKVNITILGPGGSAAVVITDPDGNIIWSSQVELNASITFGLPVEDHEGTWTITAQAGGEKAVARFTVSSSCGMDQVAPGGEEASNDTGDTGSVLSPLPDFDLSLPVPGYVVVAAALALVGGVVVSLLARRRRW